MRVVKLSAKNYRALEDISIEFGKNYCTLSGKNNAGKSAVIRLLNAVFRAGRHSTWSSEGQRFEYIEDKTQWLKDEAPINVCLQFELTRSDDSALINVIEKLAQTSLQTEVVELEIAYIVTKDDQTSLKIAVNGSEVPEIAAKEIDKRIKGSNLLMLHNSTSNFEQYVYGVGQRSEFLLSADERVVLEKADRNMQSKLRKMSRRHTQGLGQLLGRLSEKYSVEATPYERFTARRLPIGLNLRDKTVEVALDDWGSGTQNRTHILTAVLQANRIKTNDPDDEKITPIVVVEEPESFLHPSAQAEFGRILRAIAFETGIQLIVTTHSPHMLNQEEPTANILLARKGGGSRLLGTKVEKTDGDSWMTPFADHLGIGSHEFDRIRPLFAVATTHVLMVEGQIDLEYFEFFKSAHSPTEKLNSNIQVVAYGGKDTLKNTLLLQFVLQRFERVFITFDLDAESDCSAALSRLGLKPMQDYMPIGLKAAGKDCIEGLLPISLVNGVMSKSGELALVLAASNGSERKHAKERLKRECLKAFKGSGAFPSDELKEMNKVIRHINKRLAP